MQKCSLSPRDSCPNEKSPELMNACCLLAQSILSTLPPEDAAVVHIVWGGGVLTVIKKFWKKTNCTAQLKKKPDPFCHGLTTTA